MNVTATRTEQVQVSDVEQGDLIQMGTEQGHAFFREVLRIEVYEEQTTGRRVLLTLASTSGEQTMTDLLPFLTVTRVADVGELIGRLILDDHIELGDPGDHRVIFEDGEPVALAFILPSGTHGRIPAKGHGDGESDEWDISITEDGKVTVSPSINAEGIWHGFLQRGVWRRA